MNENVLMLWAGVVMDLLTEVILVSGGPSNGKQISAFVRSPHVAAVAAMRESFLVPPTPLLYYAAATTRLEDRSDRSYL